MLEDRRLLSTIQWVNRGTGDGFTNLFGTSWIDTNSDGRLDTRADNVARQVVDAAITAWEHVIEDFNFSDGTNLFQLTVIVPTTGAGLSASAGPTGSPDPVTGAWKSGSMTINRGYDGDGDSVGDGYGWFLDVTPNEHSEFLGDIVNAFTGKAQAGSPIQNPPSDIDGDGLPNDLDGDGNPDTDLDGDGFADVLYDLFTPVVHELGHALGFLDVSNIIALSTLVPPDAAGNPQLDTVDGTTGPDADGDGKGDGPAASLWAFNGPSI